MLRGRHSQDRGPSYDAPNAIRFRMSAWIAGDLVPNVPPVRSGVLRAVDALVGQRLRDRLLVSLDRRGTTEA